jgi:hypothetical protein
MGGDSEMSQKGFDLNRAHGAWMLELMKPNEALDPIRVTSFGADRVMHGADRLPDLVEELHVWSFRALSAIVADYTNSARLVGKSRITPPRPNSVHLYHLQMQADSGIALRANDGPLICSRIRFNHCSAWKAIGGASVEESGGVRAGNCSESDAHPPWVVPFWMLLALAAMFALGCVFGSFLTWLSMLGPFGPGRGPGVD